MALVKIFSFEHGRQVVITSAGNYFTERKQRVLQKRHATIKVNNTVTPLKKPQNLNSGLVY